MPVDPTSAADDDQTRRDLRRRNGKLYREVMASLPDDEKAFLDAMAADRAKAMIAAMQAEADE